MYAGGGGGGGGGEGRGIFFQRLVFFISPPSNQPKNEYPPPPHLLPDKKYQNKYLYNSTLYMFEISRDMFNKNIERALTVYVIPNCQPV